MKLNVEIENMNFNSFFLVEKKEFYFFGLWLSIWKNLSKLPLISKWCISIISRIKQNNEFFSVIHENEVLFPGISPWNNFFHSNMKELRQWLFEKKRFSQTLHKSRKITHNLILSQRLYTNKCISMQANVKTLWLFQHNFITKHAELLTKIGAEERIFKRVFEWTFIIIFRNKNERKDDQRTCFCE